MELSHKQYQIDIKEILSVLKSRETFREGEKLMEFRNRSLAFTKEFHFLKIYLSGGMEFYEALSVALEDPIMSYIISFEDMDCLFDYVDRKYNFWSLFFNQQIYSFTLLLLTIICSFYISRLFNNFSFFFLKMIIYYFLNTFVSYILTAIFVFYIYREYCGKYIFLHYFDHKISLSKLFYKQKSKDTLYIISQLESKKIHKKDTLINQLNNKWRIINVIPFIVCINNIVIILFFFCLNILNIFQNISNVLINQ
jgi:hypothetical protein